jgi:myo-inositol-1(or 4)-monophosphatase
VTDPLQHPEILRAVAERLAAEAAAVVAHRRTQVFGRNPAEFGAVGSKSTPTDPVTVVDTETEALLRRRLAELRPGDPVLGEEGGGPRDAGTRTDAVTWVLDPIDGTVNFVYGIPAYAVSVAAQVGGVVLAGAVADVSTGDIYSAGSGLGAHVLSDGDRRPLRCSAITELSMVLLGTGFGYSPGRRAAQAALLAGLLPVVRDVRRIGSAALDLCMVAAGRLDAHYEHGLNVWDWAAGALIATEAGARVTLPPPDAGPASLVMAAAPGVANALYEMLDRLGGLAALPE